MGAYSPVPAVGDDVVGQVMDRCVEPTLAELRRRGIDYRGILYAGLMLTADGPKLVEYNVRFGDPESQVVLPRLTTDLAGLLAEAAAGDRSRRAAASSPTPPSPWCWRPRATRPAPRTGDVIAGIAEAEALGATVFCAGVAAGADGTLVTAGGRVLDVTATGPTLADARARAYAAADRISWPGVHRRPDIARAAAAAAG